MMDPNKWKPGSIIVNKTIWQLSREWWNHRSEFGEGFVSRAFDLWRSHPTWYMHEVLVEDCVRKQGCCSRGCGCCAKRQLSTRQLAAGHCALTCGCCRTARGFELTQEEENEIYAAQDFQANTNFYDRIELASIWGLRLDSYESPFDLIKSGGEQVDDGNGELCRTDYTENWDDDSSITEESWFVLTYPVLSSTKLFYLLLKVIHRKASAQNMIFYGIRILKKTFKRASKKTAKKTAKKTWQDRINDWLLLFALKRKIYIKCIGKYLGDNWWWWMNWLWRYIRN